MREPEVELVIPEGAPSVNRATGELAVSQQNAEYAYTAYDALSGLISNIETVENLRGALYQPVNTVGESSKDISRPVALSKSWSRKGSGLSTESPKVFEPAINLKTHIDIPPDSLIQETKEIGDNNTMTNAEQYYQKAIDASFKALDTHIKSMDGHLGQLRWVMTTGIAVVSILIAGIYFMMNFGFSGLNTKIDSKYEQINTKITEMDKRYEQRQALYEKYIDAKLEQNRK